MITIERRIKKKTFFFLSLFWKNVSTQWRSGHRHFETLFQKKTPLPSASWKKILLIGNKTKKGKKTFASVFFVSRQMRLFESFRFFLSKKLKKLTVSTLDHPWPTPCNAYLKNKFSGQNRLKTENENFLFMTSKNVTFLNHHIDVRK